MGSPYVSDPSIGFLTQLNITTPTLVAAGAGLVASVSVVVPGSAAGTVNDAASTGAASAANAFLTLPPTNTSFLAARWKVDMGIVVVPGTGQTIAISYSK
jgi:hypothetical protein